MGASRFIICENDEDQDRFGPVSPSSSSSSYSSSPPSPSSSASSSPQLDDEGPLYKLSSLMTHLPSKRGLSCYFSGKSQSFSSLASVKCVEDLAKKEVPLRRKMKSSKSYGGVAELLAHGPGRKTISKKSSRGSCASLAARRSLSGAFIPKPPLVPVHKSSLANILGQ